MSRASPKLLGVFVVQLDDAYQIAVWRGIDLRARERGIGVVCFVWHGVSCLIGSEAAANIAYRIGDPLAVGRLIVVSSAIATFLGPEEMTGRFATRKGIPQVCVGLPVLGMPTVAASGAEGVSTVVRHLVREHGLRHFALICGPAGHAETVERERAFRATLRIERLEPSTRVSCRVDCSQGQP